MLSRLYSVRRRHCRVVEVTYLITYTNVCKCHIMVHEMQAHDAVSAFTGHAWHRLKTCNGSLYQSKTQSATPREAGLHNRCWGAVYNVESIKGISRQLSRRRKDRVWSLSSSASSAASQTSDSSAGQFLDREHDTSSAVRWFYAFFKFTRPHTMLGTLVSIISVSLLALVSDTFQEDK